MPSYRPPSRVYVRPPWYYHPYAYGAFGLGYFYYDPYWGWGYPGYAYPSAGYYAPDTGSLRVKVKPTHAEVLADGYYVGLVDDFDGLFQRLKLPPGHHRIEVRANGYRPLAFDVRVIAGDTITYRGELEPIP